MNRRQFVCTATVGGTCPYSGRARAATAMKYDLIVKGGGVVDPSRKLNAIRDVTMADGHNPDR